VCSFVSENMLRQIECSYELRNLYVGGNTYNLNGESRKAEVAVQLFRTREWHGSRKLTFLKPAGTTRKGLSRRSP
jgi:hypothetical protein